MEIKNLLDNFIEYLKDKGRSNSTVIAYKKDIEQLLEFLVKDKNTTAIKTVNTEMLDEYVEGLKHSGDFTLKTISRKINSLKTFFKHLHNEKLIVSDPAADVKHPEFQPQLPRVLSPLEYRALRDVARNNLRLYTMVELLLQTGIRIGELSRLKKSDVVLEGDKKYIKVEEFSSNPYREVEVNPVAEEALVKFMKKDNESAYLFSTKNGRPVLIRNIRTAVNRAFYKAGIKNATVNDIRNTFIVYQLENGMSIKTLANIAGHQKQTTTERYLQLLPEKPKRLSGTKVKPL